MRKTSGFTLIEVIVAISIFALIGLGCYRVLYGISVARDTLAKKTEYLRELSKAIFVIESDFGQLARRSISDENGKLQPPLVSSDEDYLVEFSRHGFKNPLMEKRSEVIRVAYQFHTKDDIKDLEIFEDSPDEELNVTEQDSRYLVRYVWPVLDRGNNVVPSANVILSDIKGIKFEYLDDKNIWEDEWPKPKNNTLPGGNDLPYAVRIKVDTIKYGPLERMFSVKPLPDLIN